VSKAHPSIQKVRETAPRKQSRKRAALKSTTHEAGLLDPPCDNSLEGFCWDLLETDRKFFSRSTPFLEDPDLANSWKQPIVSGPGLFHLSSHPDSKNPQICCSCTSYGGDPRPAHVNHDAPAAGLVRSGTHIMRPFLSSAPEPPDALWLATAARAEPPRRTQSEPKPRTCPAMPPMLFECFMPILKFSFNISCKINKYAALYSYVKEKRADLKGSCQVSCCCHTCKLCPLWCD